MPAAVLVDIGAAPFGYSLPGYYEREFGYFLIMYETYIKREMDRATQYSYWMGAAFGMTAGAVLGVMVGLLW
jgi:hypothetical protein